MSGEEPVAGPAAGLPPPKRISKLSESWIQMESPWPTSIKKTVGVVVVGREEFY
jgi:hypothetical protein